MNDAINNTDTCQHCGYASPKGLAQWPRIFRKDLLLCYSCWKAFFEGDNIEKALRRKLLHG